MSHKNYLLKLALATLGAYIASYTITRTVIYADRPTVRPEFVAAITSLPTKIRESPGQAVAYLRAKTPNPLAWFPGMSTTPSEPSPYRGRIVYVPPPPILNPPSDGGTGGGDNPQPPPQNPLPITSSPSEPTEIPPLPSQPQPTTLPPAERPTMQPQPPAPPPSEQAAAFLGLLNAERSKNGAGPLQFNSALNKAAQDYANILNTCDHMQGGSTPFQRARSAGYPTSNVGENITCMGRWTPESAFNAWMSSSAHRSNMLNGSWHGVGLGIGGYGWVLLMGPI